MQIRMLYDSNSIHPFDVKISLQLKVLILDIYECINHGKNCRGMPEAKLKQLQYETDTWKRLLGFMVEENIHLKNRIAEILRNGFAKDKLDVVEEFQSKFIKQDDLVKLIRHQVVELDKLLVREVFEDGKIINAVNKKLGVLRSNVTLAEKEFTKLKVSFNNYLLEELD